MFPIQTLPKGLGPTTNRLSFVYLVCFKRLGDNKITLESSYTTLKNTKHLFTGMWRKLEQSDHSGVWRRVDVWLYEVDCTKLIVRVSSSSQHPVSLGFLFSSIGTQVAQSSDIYYNFKRTICSFGTWPQRASRACAFLHVIEGFSLALKFFKSLIFSWNARSLAFYGRREFRMYGRVWIFPIILSKFPPLPRQIQKNLHFSHRKQAQNLGKIVGTYS